MREGEMERDRRDGDKQRHCVISVCFLFSSSASHDDAPRTLLTKSGSLNSRV